MQLKLSIGVMLLWLSVFNQQLVFAAEKQRSQLQVQVNSASSNEGVIRVLLLNSKEQFEQLDGHYKACSKALKECRVTCSIQDIANADYAVFSFHDKNVDAELNFSLLLSATEKMAVSNIELADNDDPTFEQSKFNSDSLSSQNFF